MPRNDPENIKVDSHGLALLVCDYCGTTFTRALTEALAQMKRNKGGHVYCCPSCTGRGVNVRRRAAVKEKRNIHVCLIRPGKEACPLTSTPLFRPDGTSLSGFRPETDTEIDMTVALLRAVATIKKYAPPDHEGAADTRAPDDVIAWERADAEHSLASFLLDREVSRRKA